MKQKPFTLARLFVSMLTLSAFTFGGGFVIISLMNKRFVEDYGWMEEQELLDLVSIAQAAPGPIAINAAIVVGHHLAGMRGFFVSVVGMALPPLIIISLISLAYDAFRTNRFVSAMLRTMQGAVAAIIADVVCSMGGKVLRERNVLSILLMVGAFVASFFFKVNIVLIILACGLIGMAPALVQGRRARS